MISIHPLERKYERMLTTATAITVNPREPKITRIILLLLYRAYVLAPNTAEIRRGNKKSGRVMVKVSQTVHQR